MKKVDCIGFYDGSKNDYFNSILEMFWDRAIGTEPIKSVMNDLRGILNTENFIQMAKYKKGDEEFYFVFEYNMIAKDDDVRVFKPKIDENGVRYIEVE